VTRRRKDLPDDPLRSIATILRNFLGLATKPKNLKKYLKNGTGGDKKDMQKHTHPPSY
jgi:hypothetical protein